MAGKKASNRNVIRKGAAAALPRSKRPTAPANYPASTGPVTRSKDSSAPPRSKVPTAPPRSKVPTAPPRSKVPTAPPPRGKALTGPPPRTKAPTAPPPRAKSPTAPPPGVVGRTSARQAARRRTIPIQNAAPAADLALLIERALETVEKYQLTAAPGTSASFEAVLAAEQRAGRPFPADYRVLLTLRDGVMLDGYQFLGTSDWTGDTKLARAARAFVAGRRNLDRCMPIAHWAQPNHWLFYDPDGKVRGAPGYLFFHGPEFTAIAGLAAAIEEIRATTEAVYGGE